MKTEIIGTVLPVLHVDLEPGERLISESGELSWKTPNITISTTMASGGVSSLFGAIGRAVSGGGLFMNEYSTDGKAGSVAFSAKVPGKIVEKHVTPTQSYLLHRHGFLCGTLHISLKIDTQRSLGSGLFGGNGFILQRVSGNGVFWVELGGEIIVKNLARGEVIDVHPGHVGLFEDTVSFDIKTIPGLQNKIFGGNGFFLARLCGPGEVWLQTLTLPNLAHSLQPYMAPRK